MIRKIWQILAKFFTEEDQVFFVGSPDKLPEPLSKEEETHYVSLAMQGDEKAKDKLIEHNLRLVVFLAKNMKIQKLI